MGVDFCDISLSILGLVDDSTKLYDTPYTRMYANENCVTQLQCGAVVVGRMRQSIGARRTDAIAVQHGVMNA